MKNKKQNPLILIVISFILLILIGSLLLYLPVSHKVPVKYIDTLFTSTSAVCVTGLNTLDTPSTWTLFGQFVIVALIQLGGLGIMTFSIGLLSILGGNLSIKWRYTFQSVYNEANQISILSILKRILLYTFAIETITATLLMTQFYPKYGFSEALWNSIFHSVSAFCNAGFSTFSNNLMDYQFNSVVVFAISTAIILGGIGFLVMTEVLGNLVHSQKKFKASTYSLHTKLVIKTTLILLIVGTVLIVILEKNNTMLGMTPYQKFLAGYFQSVTCRTAGFNTLDIGKLTDPTLLVMIVLMFIGGSPGSIAGGVKTTTIGVLFAIFTSRLRGHTDIVISNRTIPRDILDKANSLLVFSFIFIGFATFILLIVGSLKTNNIFLASLFETTSAFGTVGLSVGITPLLSSIGKFILCLVMFIGRLGPLTLISIISIDRKKNQIKYPETNLMIG